MLVFQIKAFWEIGSCFVLPPVNVRAELCKEQFSWCLWLSQHSQLAFKYLCSGTCPCSCVPLIYWLGWSVQPFTDVWFCWDYTALRVYLHDLWRRDQICCQVFAMTSQRNLKSQWLCSLIIRAWDIWTPSCNAISDLCVEQSFLRITSEEVLLSSGC